MRFWRSGRLCGVPWTSRGRVCVHVTVSSVVLSASLLAVVAPNVSPKA